MPFSGLSLSIGTLLSFARPIQFYTYHHICIILTLIIPLKYQVASAVLDWARDNGASVYTHWFQPLGSSGVRWGLASGVQNTMMEFLPDGTPAWDFKGKHLLNGETDGSSYVNGGLRGTHQAGGKYCPPPPPPPLLSILPMGTLRPRVSNHTLTLATSSLSLSLSLFLHYTIYRINYEMKGT